MCGAATMEALDAPTLAVISDHYSALYNDIFGDAASSEVISQSGWVYFALTIPYAVVAWTIAQNVLLFIGTRAGMAAGYPKKRSHNIGDSFREFIGMSTQSGLAFLILRKQSWVWDVSRWDYAVFEGPTFQNHTSLTDDGVPLSFAAYYPLEFGWYMGLLICMLMDSPRKSDFVVMMLHHLVTMFLVGLSACVGHTRIGVLVMLLHDSSDTLLHGSKILHYAFEGSPIHVLCDITFATFAFVFFITRLVLYPYLLYVTGVMGYNCGFTGTEWSLFTALAVLVPFHMYWFALIMKILMEALIGGEVQGDVRDDDEVDYERKKAIGLVDAPAESKKER